MRFFVHGDQNLEAQNSTPLAMRFLFVFLLSLTAVSFSADKPNILLITADDLGLQLSCYGDPYLKTPHLDKLAAGGVRYRTAYVAQASCSSSRSSMFSGLYPHTTGQIGLANAGFQLASEQVEKNLPAWLKRADYRTGILGKLHVNPESSFPFDYRPKRQDTRDVRDVAKRAAPFLQAESDRPFFLMVNYSDPHVWKEPKKKKPIFPAQWKGLPENPIAEDTVPGWDFQGFDEPVARQRVSNYYNTVLRLDRGVGFLLDELEKSGHADNTLVIFLGDHGPPFSRGKTTCYESGLRVPFLLRWPGVAQQNISSLALVSAVDIVPTILDAAGIEAPEEFHGASLRPTLTNSIPPENWRTHLAGEFHYHGTQGFFPRRAIRDQRYKLIHNLIAGKGEPISRVDGDPNGQFADTDKYRDTPAGKAFQRYVDPPEWELYDLDNDPVEFENLADNPEHSEKLSELKFALMNWRKETNDPLLSEDGFKKFEQWGKEAEARMKKK